MALRGKQKAFVNYYLGEAKFNATRAAELAGYNGDSVSWANIGSQNLKKPNIKAAIDEYWAAHSMPAAEAVARLADIARANLGDFLSVQVVPGPQGDRTLLVIDMDKVKAGGHLVSEISYTRYGPKIKLHDSLGALRDIVRIHKLIGGNVQPVLNIDYESLSDDQIMRLAGGESPYDVLRNSSAGAS